MTDTALPLDDDDFTEDAPPGYRTYADKEKYVPRMILLLAITFVAQMILPTLINLAMMPFFMFQTANVVGGVGQQTKAVAWQGALWYPSVGGVSGQFRAGCQLMSLGYDGKKAARPAIELDMQPDWLLADGDKLWAVSRNQVGELFADGTRPVVMFPTRYLINPSPPFMYAGKLTVEDHDAEANEPFRLYHFQDGEWMPGPELVIPDFGPPISAASQEFDPEDPADAASPANVLDVEAEQAKIQRQLERKLAQSLPTPFGSPTASEFARKLQIQEIGGELHFVLEQGGKFYHRIGLPTAAGEDATWQTVRIIFQATNASGYWTSVWKLTEVESAPAILVVSGPSSPTATLWRLDEGAWQQRASHKLSGSLYNPEATACVTPEDRRTLAVVTSMSGMSEQLLELKADKIEKISSLGGDFNPADPFTAMMGLYIIVPQIVVHSLALLQLFGVTWLMKRHRDPYYYKGRIPVAYASLIRRCLAVFIDSIMVNAIVFGGMAWWYLARNQTFVEMASDLEADPWKFFQDLAPMMISLGAWSVFWGLVWWLMTAYLCGTPGKLLCGVRVVRTNLEPPGLLRALVRMIIWVVETGLFQGIVAIATMAFTQNRQRIADMVGGTIVVKADSLKQARAEFAALKLAQQPASDE